ncbi:hypothetical protein ZEAMMB73_Zm00001d000128, partial [Zea mays]
THKPNVQLRNRNGSDVCALPNKATILVTARLPSQPPAGRRWVRRRCRPSSWWPRRQWFACAGPLRRRRTWTASGRGRPTAGSSAPELGPEGLTVGNIIAGDHLSLAYDRTPEEILGIVYGTGNSAQHGGFFPQGADGRIARGLLA